MSVKERVIEYIKYKKLSQTKFEKTIGLANGFVNNIGKSIRGESLDRISKVFPELNKSWLILGEGSMLRDSPGTEPQLQKADEVSYPEKEKLQWEVESLKKRIEEIKNDYNQVISQLTQKNELLIKEVAVLNERFQLKGIIRDKRMQKNTS